MGEATYYCKMRYENEEKRNIGMDFVKRFFEEGARAYDFWQDNRHLNSAEFWLGFSEKYPLVNEYLGSCCNVEDTNNGLSGLLDFGSEDDVESQLMEHGPCEIWYWAEVWHFADWDPIMAFVSQKTGAQTAWLSDEHADIFDCI